MRVNFQPGKRPIQPDPTWQENAPPLPEARCQLEEYFQGERRHFTLRLAPQGTPFQQRVWQELLRIPYGTPITYMDACVAMPPGWRSNTGYYCMRVCRSHPAPRRQRSLQNKGAVAVA